MARSRALSVLDVAVGAVGVVVSLFVGWACFVLTTLLDDVVLTVVATFVILVATLAGIAGFASAARARRRSWWWPWAASAVSLATFYVSAAITAVRLG